MARVPASEATRKRLKQIFEGGAAQQFERSDLVKQAVRLMIEEALEAEVTEAVGRDYYARSDGPDGSGGHRNGYRMGRLDTAEGRIEYAVPQVRGLEGWRSEVRAAVGGKTDELERLAIEMYARGLSMRDIEAAFTDERGRSVLSRSAASRVAEQLWAVTRTTNLLERLFGEERRRTKTIPHAFGERAVMKLMYASLIRASQTWRGVPITDFERKQLDTLREELDNKFNELHAVPLKQPSRSRVYSKDGT